MTRECISRILELREIFLSMQTGFSLVNAAIVGAVMEGTYSLEPSSVITEMGRHTYAEHKVTLRG